MQGERHCPECGAAMQLGTAAVMSYAAGMTWHKERSALALGGETIVSAPLGCMIWLDGHRCPDCRRLEVHYGKPR